MRILNGIAWVLIALLASICVQAGVEKSAPVTIVLLGPPGSGKGTLAQHLSKAEGFPVVTVSQVLKNQMRLDPVLNERLSALMSEGKLVPDDVVSEVLQKEIVQDRYSKGVIFDGFPRTLAQCDFFSKQHMVIDLMIVLDISDDAIAARMGGRRVHTPSGRMYHVDSMPPRVAGQDDVTGEPLVQREDDKPEIVRARLQDYHEQTEPIIDWAKQQALSQSGMVKKVVAVDAAVDFEQVIARLCEQLNEMGVHLNQCSVSA